MLPGIHRGTLSYELRRLEADRILQRTQYPIPPTVEYTPTARGAALARVGLVVSMEQVCESRATQSQCNVGDELFVRPATFPRCVQRVTANRRLVGQLELF